MPTDVKALSASQVETSSMPVEASKQHKAFIRKLYLAHLIDNESHNLTTLNKTTGMPRRTLQDALAALKDIGIECIFVQQGERHNAGYYKINTWGPISPAWVVTHFDEIETMLNDGQT